MILKKLPGLRQNELLTNANIDQITITCPRCGSTYLGMNAIFDLENYLMYTCGQYQFNPKPEYPLTNEEEQELIDFDENYASQYDSLAGWENEVKQFGDATFPRPVIKPFIYPDKLQHWIDLVEQYNADLKKWEAESTEDEDDCQYDDIPF